MSRALLVKNDVSSQQSGHQDIHGVIVAVHAFTSPRLSSSCTDLAVPAASRKRCWFLHTEDTKGVAAASVVFRNDRAKETYITLALDWAMNWGTWGPQEFCPEGTFAYAFQIKVEPEDATDDTSMNAIQLFCRHPADVGHDGHPPREGAKEFSITSNEAQWGDWRGKRVCDEGLLTGLKMKSEEYQGFFIDDTAANDLEMQCNHSTLTLNGGGNRWGHYSNWATCPVGWAICGLMTRVEAASATDDTALNDVRMYCCQK